jgi:hypothetical protein
MQDPSSIWGAGKGVGSSLGATSPGIDWRGMLEKLGPGLANLFGEGMGMLNDKWVNPATKAGETIAGIPEAMKPYYDPFINAGKGALPELQSQYGSLLNDPGAFMNKIGSSYQQSPGFNFALQQALQGAGHAAAAGGMAGSPQHEAWNMERATNLANQDYNNWLSKALNMYGRGLSGEESLYTTGFGASTDIAKNIQDALAKQAELQYKGQAEENERQRNQGSIWNTIGNLAMTAIPFFL